MQVLMNLLPIVSGGGLQNALSLIQNFSTISNKRDFLFIVRKGTEADQLCQACNLERITVPNSNRDRMLFELSARRRFQKGQTCFTLFGPVMLGTSGYLNNVVGCAYSNLFYPEVPFWSYLPFHSRLKKSAIDLYRRKLLSKGDFWIFETEALKRRAIELCNFPAERVEVVPMATSSLVSRSNVSLPSFSKFSRIQPDRFKFLFLSGAHPNKRLHLLPAIAAQMRAMGCEGFSFITTFSEETPYSRLVTAEMQRQGLSDHFRNIGKVAPAEVPSLIASINCICTFSLLESFSNNFVEAWKMEVPLVVTDGDWSRASCGEGAIYVDPADARQCAQSLVRICSDPLLVSAQVEKGSQQLKKYPDPERKLHLYLDLITRAQEMGAAPGVGRQIKWC